MSDNDDRGFIDALLDGRQMVVESTADGLAISFTETRGRQCGPCQLCCKLLPVPTINKLDGERCKHQRVGKGCAIYASRPSACQAFVCRWLADPAAAGMPRPDRAHYVIDAEQDTVLITYDDGDAIPVAVIQVWVDPAFPNAWDEPHLRAYMVRAAEKFRMATIIRSNSRDALVVFPPAIAADGEWHYERRHTLKSKAEMQDKIAEVTGSHQTVKIVTSEPS